MRAATLSFVLVSLALTACDRPAPGKPLRQAYQCGDLAVTAEFPTPDAVALAWPGNSLALKRVPAASGANRRTSHSPIPPANAPPPIAATR